MFGWFDAKEACAFGESLAEFLAARLPPDDREGHRSEKKRREVLPKLMAQAERFGQSHYPLNMYKKARLGNAFRWKLVDLGYEKQFSDELTQEVLAKL